MAIFALGKKAPLLAPDVWIAENASVIGDVRLGKGVSVWFNAVIRGDNEPIIIGEESNIQDCVTLHNDINIPLVIGARVTIGHGAVVHGCHVGDGTLIGIHAVILNRAVIGRECLIGAHTLIPEGKVIPDRSLVVGVPARIVRTLSEEEIKTIYENAHHYLNASRHYSTELHRIA